MPSALTVEGPLYQVTAHLLGLPSSFEIGEADKHAILAFMISSTILKVCQLPVVIRELELSASENV
jgi:hypothetical protein